MQPAPHCGKPIWLPRGKGGRGEGDSRGPVPTTGGQPHLSGCRPQCPPGGGARADGRQGTEDPAGRGRCRERDLAAWSEAGHARARAALRTEAAD